MNYLSSVLILLLCMTVIITCEVQKKSSPTNPNLSEAAQKIPYLVVLDLEQNYSTWRLEQYNDFKAATEVNFEAYAEQHSEKINKYIGTLETFSNEVPSDASDPSIPLARFVLAHLYYYQQNYDASLQYFKATQSLSTEANPNDTKNQSAADEASLTTVFAPKACLYQAFIHEKQGNYQQAKTLYQTFIKTYSDSVYIDFALYHLGLCHEAQQENIKAAATYQFLLEQVLSADIFNKIEYGPIWKERVQQRFNILQSNLTDPKIFDTPFTHQLETDAFIYSKLSPLEERFVSEELPNPFHSNSPTLFENWQTLLSNHVIIHLYGQLNAITQRAMEQEHNNMDTIRSQFIIAYLKEQVPIFVSFLLDTYYSKSFGLIPPNEFVEALLAERLKKQSETYMQETGQSFPKELHTIFLENQKQNIQVKLLNFPLHTMDLLNTKDDYSLSSPKQKAETKNNPPFPAEFWWNLESAKQWEAFDIRIQRTQLVLLISETSLNESEADNLWQSTTQTTMDILNALY